MSPSDGKRLFHFRDWRILTKLLVTMLVLSWIPLSALMALNIQSRSSASRTEMENVILRQISDTVDEIQQRVMQFVQENHDTIREIGQSPDIVQFLGAPPAERKQLQQRVDSMIHELVASTPAIGSAQLYDSEGVAIASSDLLNLGRDEQDRQDVRAALTGEPSTSGIHIGMGSDDSAGFFISTPVRRGPETVGAISARIQADLIAREPGRDDNLAEYDAFTDVYLVNEHGIVMVHSDPVSDWLYHLLGDVDAAAVEAVQSARMLGGKCPENRDPCSPDEKELRQLEPIPAVQPLANTLLDAYQSSQGGETRYCRPSSVDAPADDACSDGTWHQAAYEPVLDPIHDEVLFLIVVDVSEAPFLDPIKQQTIASVGGALFLALLLFLASIAIARTVAHPILTLAAAAQAVEQEEPFEPESIADVTAQSDEIGNLARVFRDMVVALQERERKLRQQVQELHIQIDEAKRRREVKAIVEDDFFQDLQAKAKELRQRRRGS